MIRNSERVGIRLHVVIDIHGMRIGERFSVSSHWKVGRGKN